MPPKLPTRPEVPIIDSGSEAAEESGDKEQPRHAQRNPNCEVAPGHLTTALDECGPGTCPPPHQPGFPALCSLATFDEALGTFILSRIGHGVFPS